MTPLSVSKGPLSVLMYTEFANSMWLVLGFCCLCTSQCLFTETLLSERHQKQVDASVHSEVYFVYVVEHRISLQLHLSYTL